MTEVLAEPAVKELPESFDLLIQSGRRERGRSGGPIVGTVRSDSEEVRKLIGRFCKGAKTTFPLGTEFGGSSKSKATMPALPGAMTRKASTEFHQEGLRHGKGNDLRGPAVGAAGARLGSANRTGTRNREFLDEGL